MGIMKGFDESQDEVFFSLKQRKSGTPKELDLYFCNWSCAGWSPAICLRTSTSSSSNRPLAKEALGWPKACPRSFLTRTPGPRELYELESENDAQERPQESESCSRRAATDPAITFNVQRCHLGLALATPRHCSVAACRRSSFCPIPPGRRKRTGPDAQIHASALSPAGRMWFLQTAACGQRSHHFSANTDS